MNTTTIDLGYAPEDIVSSAEAAIWAGEMTHVHGMDTLRSRARDYGLEGLPLVAGIRTRHLISVPWLGTLEVTAVETLGEFRVYVTANEIG